MGTITEALVHLLPLPKVRGVVVLHFDSMQPAVASVGAILSCEPSAAELLDGLILRLAEKSLEYRNYLDFVVGEPESLVLVEFNGERSGTKCRPRPTSWSQSCAGQPGLFHVLPAHGQKAVRSRLGLPQGVAAAVAGPARPAQAGGVCRRRRGRARSICRSLWRGLCEIMARHDTEGAFYGHASVGCLHIRPDARPAQRRSTSSACKQISREVCELVMEFGGAMSGEHGDGLARSYLNERLFGPQIYQAFKQVKAAFDPAQPSEPRQGGRRPEPDREPALRHAIQHAGRADDVRLFAEGGLPRAVELCNGAGVCRKLQTGTMCPSFMVTRDEEHSTRGRANALRMVLSGAADRKN